jgi:tetratricopeptide (TPR) repeat protein
MAARTCTKNLARIAASKDKYYLDQELGDGSPAKGMGDLVGPGRILETYPVCPSGGGYSINDLFHFPACSAHGALRENFDIEALAVEMERYNAERNLKGFELVAARLQVALPTRTARLAELGTDWCNRGVFYRTTLWVLEGALSTDPNNSALLCNLALTEGRLDQVDTAIEHAKRALEAGYLRAHFPLALGLSKRRNPGDVEEAHQSLVTFFDNFPLSDEIRKCIPALIRNLDGVDTEMRTRFAAAIRSASSDSWLEVASKLETLDEETDREAFEKAARRLRNFFGDDADDLSAASRYLVRQNSESSKAAIALASEAQSLRPDSLEVLEALGLAEHMAGHYEDAVSHLRMCVEGGREESRPQLAEALTATGKPEEVEEGLRILLENVRKDPNNHSIERAWRALRAAPIENRQLVKELEKLASRQKSNPGFVAGDL